MRHVTWDCDGCGTTVALDFTNGDSLPLVPNGDWHRWRSYLFCPECGVHLDAAVGQLIRDRYKESK